MPKNFLLTKYFFPIQQRITLSSHFGFEFDNPRTEKEIAHVKRIITNTYNSGIVGVLPPYSKDEDIVTLELIIKKFRDTYSKDDQYIKSFFRSYKRRYLFDYLARMWCIIRFNDDGVSEDLDTIYQEMKEKGQKGFVLLDDNNPALVNSESLINYCHLLSLLSHSEGNNYFGRIFIFNPDQLFRPIVLDDLTLDLAMVYSDLHDFRERPEHRDLMDWIFWRFGSIEIIKNAETLEKAFDNGRAEQLLYVGGLLGIANQTPDIRIRLLVLTSIIELLVTHNPDTNRFNIEDSINKQFILKASILIYKNDKGNDIELIKKRLKLIYQQRSNIAHGNFEEINKITRKEGLHDYFESLVVDLYAYVRAILEVYLSDIKYVEFIKAG